MESNHQALTSMIAALMDMESFNAGSLDKHIQTFKVVAACFNEQHALNEADYRQYRHTALKIQLDISNGRTEEAFLSLVLGAQSLAADALVIERLGIATATRD